jgi:signal peptidase I
VTDPKAAVDVTASPAADREEGREHQAPKRRTFSRKRLIAIVCFAVFVGGRSQVVEVLRIRSTSMMPLIKPNSVLLMDRLTYRRRDPAIGEIVSLVHPLTGELMLKRVVGRPGDRIAIEDGVLIRNEKVVSETFVLTANMDGYFFGPVTVSPNQVFVLGDNRSESEDSRSFGPVSISRVEGRLLKKLS